MYGAKDDDDLPGYATIDERYDVAHREVGAVVRQFVGVVLFAVVMLADTVGAAEPAAAGSGPCSNYSNFYSIICDISSAQWQGVYAVWPSVPLNISQVYAESGDFIAQVTWLYNGDTLTQSGLQWLEVGDTAGGANIPSPNGPNEWARMWYWVDGSTSIERDSFWGYSPSDGSSHSYGVQWDSNSNAWDVCFSGTCQYGAVTWTNPSNFPSTTAVVGLEDATGAVLDANTNSGNFVVTDNEVLDPNGTWPIYPQAAPQVDQACNGTSLVAPQCLQGWYTDPTQPPYTNRNDGKPSQ